MTTATVLHGIVQFLSPLSAQSLRRGLRHSLQQGPGSVTKSKSFGTWWKCYVNHCSGSLYCHVTPLLSQSLLRNRSTLNAQVGCTMRKISMLGRPTKAVSKRGLGFTKAVSNNAWPVHTKVQRTAAGLAHGKALALDCRSAGGRRFDSRDQTNT